MLCGPVFGNITRASLGLRSERESGFDCDGAAGAAYNKRMKHQRLSILLALVILFALLIVGRAEIGPSTSQQPAVAAAGEKRGTVVLVYETSSRRPPAAGAWIWRANANGEHRKRLIRGRMPVVSPDGRTIAFMRIRQVATLWLMRSTGSHGRPIIRIDGGFGLIVWSPDSRHVLVSDRDGLRLVDRAGNSVRSLRVTEPTSSSAINTVSFSADSGSIAYDRVDAIGSDIFALSLSGGPSQQLTHDHQSFGPLWGPHKIAYLRGRGFVDGDIWLMNGDGGHNRRLTRTAAGFYPAAWSRSGERLLGANPANHNGRLWAVHVPSGHARALTKWTGDLFAQGLSRDGRTVYAAIGCGGAVSSRGLLETIPFSGGRPKVIVRGPCRGSWSE
jgi:Tol biopolymer transport system component